MASIGEQFIEGSDGRGSQHPATAELLKDAVMRNGLSDRWRESYVCEKGKSMKAVWLAGLQKDCW
jgi:hypothetical protein